VGRDGASRCVLRALRIIAATPIHHTHCRVSERLHAHVKQLFQASHRARGSIDHRTVRDMRRASVPLQLVADVSRYQRDDVAMLPAASRAAFGAALTGTHVRVNRSVRGSSWPAPLTATLRQSNRAWQSPLLINSANGGVYIDPEPRRGRTQVLRPGAETAATDLWCDWSIRDRRTVHRERA